MAAAPTSPTPTLTNTRQVQGEIARLGGAVDDLGGQAVSSFGELRSRLAALEAQAAASRRRRKEAQREAGGPLRALESRLNILGLGVTLVDDAGDAGQARPARAGGDEPPVLHARRRAGARAPLSGARRAWAAPAGRMTRG